MNDTTIKGFINESHASDIEANFGSELADKVRNADEGETFLSILFAGFADKN